MKILIFTEGTILMHKNGRGLLREEIIKQVKNKEISVGDYTSYIPIGNAPEKVRKWKENGATISYLTSRTKSEETKAIRDVLKRWNFPEGELLYRKGNETYANVAEKIMPDIFIEDDCESIGGEVEMVRSYLTSRAKMIIKSVIVGEFLGIDNLPDKISELTETTYQTS